MCKYCKTDCEGYIQPLDKNAHVFLRETTQYRANLIIEWYGHYMDIPIKYCPICGRDLKDGI